MRWKEKRISHKTRNRKGKSEKRLGRKKIPLYRNLIRYFFLAVMGTFLIVFLLEGVGTVAHAVGLVDDSVNISNDYSKYALSNYQLDFYVDSSWDWLPWNWSDGLGKSVMYALYAITNFIWTISLYLSNATGYLVQEAYELDFISQTTDAIGKNIQTIAGVTKNGFSSSGFYVGFLLIFILILGIYVAYAGILKRETTKALQAVLNFVVVFILSASFIAYAPDYVGKINDFSKDVSNAALDMGTKIVMPDSKTQGKDSTDMIRNSLFSIQVKQPWLLLEFGSTDTKKFGAERIENLLSTSPETNNGKDREDVVIKEIENHKNSYLTVTNTISRLGTVFFLFLFNAVISIFIFLLTGTMIFSQVLFILFAMFLPVSFLLSMIPSFEGMGKRTIMKLFNVIMTRAGITLIITVAFSISTMLYSLSGSSPFFMVMFLQIVTFVGIYYKMGEIMNLFSLQSSDSQNLGRQVFRRPRTFMTQQARKLQHNMNRMFSTKTVAIKKKKPTSITSPQTKNVHDRKNSTSKIEGTPPPLSATNAPSSLGKRLGERVGKITDTKDNLTNKAKYFKDNVKNVPTNAKYALYKNNRDLIQNAQDFSDNISQTRERKQLERKQSRDKNQDNLARKRLEMDKARQRKTEITENDTFTGNLKSRYQQPILRPEKRSIVAKENMGKIKKAAIKNEKTSATPHKDSFATHQINQRTNQLVNLQTSSLQNSKLYTTKKKNQKQSLPDNLHTKGWKK